MNRLDLFIFMTASFLCAIFNARIALRISRWAEKLISFQLHARCVQGDAGSQFLQPLHELAGFNYFHDRVVFKRNFQCKNCAQNLQVGRKVDFIPIASQMCAGGCLKLVSAVNHELPGFNHLQDCVVSKRNFQCKNCAQNLQVGRKADFIPIARQMCAGGCRKLVSTAAT